MSDESTEPDGKAEGEAAKPAETKPKAKAAAKSKDAGSKGAKGKSKSKSKGKGKGGSGGLSVATHPRAHASVRRAKGWGGLAGFGIAAYLSLRSGVPPDQVGLRALAAGAAGYMVAWATMVTVWRHLVLAELRAHLEQRKPQPDGIPLKNSAPGARQDGPAPPVPN